MNNEANVNRVRRYSNGALNAASNGNMRSMNSNLGRMNAAAVNNNRPLSAREARRILTLVNSTNRKINGLAQNIGNVRNTLAKPLRKNANTLRFSNNSRG